MSILITYATFLGKPFQIPPQCGYTKIILMYLDYEILQGTYIRRLIFMHLKTCVTNEESKFAFSSLSLNQKMVSLKFNFVFFFSYFTKVCICKRPTADFQSLKQILITGFSSKKTELAVLVGRRMFLLRSVKKSSSGFLICFSMTF